MKTLKSDVPKFWFHKLELRCSLDLTKKSIGKTHIHTPQVLLYIHKIIESWYFRDVRNLKESI